MNKGKVEMMLLEVIAFGATREKKIQRENIMKNL